MVRLWAGDLHLSRKGEVDVERSETAGEGYSDF
jgi:hypothetical protein